MVILMLRISIESPPPLTSVNAHSWMSSKSKILEFWRGFKAGQFSDPLMLACYKRKRTSILGYSQDVVSIRCHSGVGEWAQVSL